MLARLLKWLIGPDEFWPGQRVMLVQNYPADIAAEAHRRFIYGTVHPANDYSRAHGNVRVLWDGFEKLRHHNASDLSSRILAQPSLQN